MHWVAVFYFLGASLVCVLDASLVYLRCIIRALRCILCDAWRVYGASCIHPGCILRATVISSVWVGCLSGVSRLHLRCIQAASLMHQGSALVHLECILGVLCVHLVCIMGASLVKPGCMLDASTLHPCSCFNCEISCVCCRSPLPLHLVMTIVIPQKLNFAG